MGDLNSFGDLADRLARAAAQLPAAKGQALARAGRAIEDRAVENIGHYQPATGPFPAWPELADSTKADRVRRGYTENDPLRRDGTMADSLESTVTAQGVTVGSEMAIAAYQELGTTRNGQTHIPARSFLGGAAVATERACVEIISEGVARAFSE